MIDAAEDYLNQVEQDAVDNPKFDLEQHVSVYNCAGQWLVDGIVLSSWWHQDNHWYEVWADNKEIKTVSEHQIDALIRSQVQKNWLTVIIGGKQ